MSSGWVDSAIDFHDFSEFQAYMPPDQFERLLAPEGCYYAPPCFRRDATPHTTDPKLLLENMDAEALAYTRQYCCLRVLYVRKSSFRKRPVGVL